jgi:non-homologous end joining protein Ku
MYKDEYYKKFNELMKKKVGEEKYNKMTKQELMNNADFLITLLDAVNKHTNKTPSPSHQHQNE